jgi:hypothetical protein
MSAMKSSFTAVKLFLAIFVACPFFALAVKAQTPASNSERKPVVVVELFTSEGCSSCPPADALLQKLETQPVPDVEIVAIEEHVDYWNHDGWVDPFSSPEWTQRQATYTALTKKDVYTPELVVDGQSQFLGSDGRQAGIEIEKAAHSPKTDVAITSGKPEGKNSQHFSVSVGKLAGNKDGDVAEIWLAVTEDGLHSAVSQGENKGREMHHGATLRTLRKIGVADANGASAFTGDAVVKLNSHWAPENLHVTVFVQEKKSREIIGAASTKIKG